MQPEEFEDDARVQKNKDKSTPEQVYVYKKHPKRKKYKINTSQSKGQLKLMRIIINDNSWQEVTKSGDLMWFRYSIPQGDIQTPTQLWVNRIPAMTSICQKKTMGFILNKFNEYWPEQYCFYPKTYLLPEDEEKLARKMQKDRIFIAKPSIGSQGEGITLIRSLNDIKKAGSPQWIVQSYIQRPLLIDKKKFDFRLYVMISSINPYICYLNEEGLARLCTQDYEQPTKQNLKNPYIHLTNYSINKNSLKFIHNDQPFGRGTKRCLKTVWEDLIAQGVDVAGLKQKIVELTQKFLIGIYPFLKYYYNATFPKNNGKNFQVLGIDILVDEKLNPWLLQVNDNPSLSIQHSVEVMEICSKIAKTKTKVQPSPVDQYVKKIVMEDSIYIALRSLQKQKQMQIGDHYYSYRKILDTQSEEINNMNIIENMLKLFHSQCSIRSKWCLNSSQFVKLSKFAGMTSDKIKKNDYHLIFIKIMRDKFNPNQMEFQHFIQAIEYVVKQLVGYTQEDKLVIMQEHMDYLISQL